MSLARIALHLRAASGISLVPEGIRFCRLSSLPKPNSMPGASGLWRGLVSGWGRRSRVWVSKGLGNLGFDIGISGVKIRITMVITHIKRLMTLLITWFDPPGKLECQLPSAI